MHVALTGRILAMNASPSSLAFGPRLREHRRARRLSQLALAAHAEVSQRHLSYLESGRSQPSRAMVIQLARALDLPLRECNCLLTSAGFAAAFPQHAFDTPDMAPVRRALEMLLQHHEPFPALVVDRAWNLKLQNAAVDRVFGLIGDLNAMWQRTCGDGPRNALRLTLHPHGLRPHIANFTEAAPLLLARTMQEALVHPPTQAMLDQLQADDLLPRRLQAAAAAAPTVSVPVLPLRFQAGPVTINLYTVLSTFGTAQDVTADELRVETFFPADAPSDALLRQLAHAPEAS